MAIRDKVKKAWNAFLNDEDASLKFPYLGPNYSYQPHRRHTSYAAEKTIISSIHTRISIDVASVVFRHVRLDDLGRYESDISSRLNEALQIEPNIDQGPRAFRQDIVQTMFDNGVVAIVPVDTTVDPNTDNYFDILTLRTGVIKDWMPKHVRVEVYDENEGRRREITVEKRFVAIVQNPLYDVMNEPNGTYQRLVRKLNILDVVDDRISSGKLDLIIQLPFVIKSESKQAAADQRRKSIENQLASGPYGIAYTDATEKITQLNRPAENNLLAQVEFLTNMLYAQLGLTAQVLDGTADEAAMINYYNRTVEPILEATVEAMNRTFLGPVGVRKKERIVYFRNLFKLMPLKDAAEIIDKLSRNEVITSNEGRSFLGLPPSKEEKADKLQNSNMPQPNGESTTSDSTVDVEGVLDEIDAEVTAAFAELGVDEDAIG